MIQIHIKRDKKLQQKKQLNKVLRSGKIMMRKPQMIIIMKDLKSNLEDFKCSILEIWTDYVF